MPALVFSRRCLMPLAIVFLIPGFLTPAVAFQQSGTSSEKATQPKANQKATDSKGDSADSTPPLMMLEVTINKPVNNTINQTKNSIIQSKPESKGLQSTKTTNLISTKTEVKPFTASKQVVINKKPIEKTILSSKKEESIEQKKTIIPTPRKNYSEGKGVTLNLKDDQHLDEGYERF